MDARGVSRNADRTASVRRAVAVWRVFSSVADLNGAGIGRIAGLVMVCLAVGSGHVVVGARLKLIRSPR